jgi:hypothetical protein
MKPVDVLEGGGEWSWVMPVFRLTAPKWCSKCMEPKVLTRLGTLSGSVAPGHWQSLPGAVADLGRNWVSDRWKPLVDRHTVATKASAIDKQRKQPYSSEWIESTATADRAVRRCVVSSPTNAAAPTDTINVASSNDMCADQTSIQPRSIPPLPIISCIVCAPLRACLLLVRSTGTRF